MSERSRKIALFAALGGAALLAAGVYALPRLRSARVVGGTPQERIACMFRLADDGVRGAGDAIARTAREDADVQVRVVALHILERFARPKFRATIDQAAASDEPALRAAAALTLGVYGDAAATARLEEMATSDSSVDVRVAAAEGLVRCPGPAALAALVTLLEKHGDVDVQVRAMDCLTRRFNSPPMVLHPQKDVLWWKNNVEVVKDYPQVKEAYAALGRPLEHNKANFIPEPGEEGPFTTGPVETPLPRLKDYWPQN